MKLNCRRIGQGLKGLKDQNFLYEAELSQNRLGFKWLKDQNFLCEAELSQNRLGFKGFKGSELSV